jgi:hypothetical protein
MRDVSSIGALMMKWKFVLLFRFFVYLLLSAGIHLHVEAQPRLLGLSPQGGDVFGTVYSTSINGADLRSEYVFDFAHLPLHDSCFADLDHLNYRGAKVFSEIFSDSLLNLKKK